MTPEARQFVILYHETPPGFVRPSHWDLMLETGAAALRTWAILESPVANRPLAAESLPDHRREYLEYSGEVSGGRGQVTRWDWGHYQLLQRSDTEWVLQMTGNRLQGCARLICHENQRWTFSLSSDSVRA